MASDAEDTAVRSGAVIQVPPLDALRALEHLLDSLACRVPLEGGDLAPLELGDSTESAHRTDFDRRDLPDHVLDEIRDQLEAIKVPGARDAEPATTWTELDVDSLDLVELVKALEDRFNITIHDEDLKDIDSVGRAIDLTVRLVEDTEWTRT